MAKKDGGKKPEPYTCPMCNGSGTETYKKQGRTIPYPCRLCKGKGRITR